MNFLPDFLALPYLTLVVGTVGSLLLFLSTERQIKGLRSALKLQREQMADVETRLRAGAPPEERGEPAPIAPRGSVRSKVLDLGGKGYSLERIVEESGLSQAEVDFILKVDRYVGATDQSIAIGKIS